MIVTTSRPANGVARAAPEKNLRDLDRAKKCAQAAEKAPAPAKP